MLHLRVFLALPGDVGEERKAVLEVIEAINTGPDYGAEVKLVTIAWDDPRKPTPPCFNRSPEDCVVAYGAWPSQCDLVVGIFKHRMGTPLDPTRWGTRPNGERYRSGTEFELMEAMAGQHCEDDRPPPEVWVYKCDAPLPHKGLDKAQRQTLYEQHENVLEFLESVRNPDGSLNGLYDGYADVPDFRQRFEAQLRPWVKQRLLRRNEAQPPSVAKPSPLGATADIFVSYATEDLPWVRNLVAALEAEGWSVWWDRRIPPGRTFPSDIETALSGARCVVVVWSGHSVKSHWVPDEAMEGRDSNRLVPVLRERVQPPLGFRQLQHADLGHWQGNRADSAFRLLVEGIGVIVGEPAQSTADPSSAEGAAPAGAVRPDAVLPGQSVASPPKRAASDKPRQKRPQASSPSRSQQLAAGTVFRDPLSDGGEGPEMVVVPAGSFEMGSPRDEAGRENDEGPVHTVSFIQPFALSCYLVTFDDYDQFVAATGREKPDDKGWGRGRRPVINVSWNDAVAYTRWLSGQTGRPYRIPSEAEWEYAARAGTRTRYWWGDQIGKNNANCNGCGSQWDGKQSAPVGSFPANSFGLYDMLGNVWEWVAGCRHRSYEGAPSDGSAWIGDDCDRRVVRGGSFMHEWSGIRSARRGIGDPSTSGGGIVGIRVCCVVPHVSLDR